MKTNSFRYLWILTVLLLISLFACSPGSKPPSDRESTGSAPGQIKAAASEDLFAGGSGSSRPVDSLEPTSLPVRFQTPEYTLAETKDAGASFGLDEEFVVKVGADVSSSSGSVVLRDIMKQLASLKNMNISWASDVDQYSYVDVDIRSDDDFFKAIDDLLRQRDYFHEVQGNTIIVKYKETRKFHVSMPFMTSTYSSSVGASVSNTSNTSLGTAGNTFDIWDNIRKNLDQVLDIWEDTSAASSPPPTAAAPPASGSATTPAPAPPKVSRPQSAKGFYTIDKPVGLITVTAPRVIIQKVENYLNNLKEELYKQVSIEAKIIEVTVSNEREVGIDWESLLNSSAFNFTARFGESSWSQPLGPSGSRSFTMNLKNFNLFLSALEKQGKTKVLANPRISVMNGQPALINVGKNVTYVDKVTSTISDSGVISTNVTTAEAISGIVMSVIPTIMEGDEIILHLTPVTSQLEEPIKYDNFGDNTVGLPVVNVREMSTIVKIKKGEMLVVGGLIDSVDDDNDSKVPMLGRLPVIGRLFSLDSKNKNRKELVILLRPEII